MVGFMLISFVILSMCSRKIWIFLECRLLVIGVIIFWEYLNWLIIESLFESLIVSLDWLRCALVILTFLIRRIMIRASYGRVKFKNKSTFMFVWLVGLINLFLIICFIRRKIIYFYIFFEAALIPIFLLILGWGYQPERLQAGLYIIFYTLFASLPLLIIIFMKQKDFEYVRIIRGELGRRWAGYVSIIFFIFAFLVKLPMFLVHLWLPKAHVEAPVAGSMILAGVLLKLGGLWHMTSFCLLGRSYFGKEVSMAKNRTHWGSNCQFYLHCPGWHEIFSCLFFCSPYGNCFRGSWDS